MTQLDTMLYSTALLLCAASDAQSLPASSAEADSPVTSEAIRLFHVDDVFSTLFHHPLGNSEA
jgi:hypothetical protein